MCYGRHKAHDHNEACIIFIAFFEIFYDSSVAALVLVKEFVFLFQVGFEFFEEDNVKCDLEEEG